MYWLLPAVFAVAGILLSFAFKADSSAVSSGSFAGSVALGEQDSVRRLRIVYMPKKAGIIFCAAAGIALTIISSVRLGVGYDFNLYSNVMYSLNFSDIDALSSHRFEKGLLYLLKILCIGADTSIPGFTLISLLIYPPLMVYTAKYSDCPWISLLGFLFTGAFFNSMNFMRQFISAVICAYALIYCERRRFIRYAVFILLAAAFHRSALIMLPFYLIFCVKWDGVVLGACAAVTAALFFTVKTLVQFATGFVYTDYDPDNSANIIYGVKPVCAVIFGIIFAAAFLLKKHMSGSEREINILIGCSYFNFFFELLGTRSAVVSRFGLFFLIPTALLLIPKLYGALCVVMAGRVHHVRTAAAWSAALVIGVGLVGYGVLLAINYNGAVPYRTIWDGILS
ncbi:MAG: EpsG family protein [Huintestinicola sp.]